MKMRILRAASIGLFLLVFCIVSSGQQHETKKRKALRLTGKVAVLVVRGAAKATFDAAKFTAKHIVVPAVKNVGIPLVKATPPIAAKAAKLTAKGIKNGVKAIIERHADDNERDPAVSN